MPPYLAVQVRIGQHTPEGRRGLFDLLGLGIPRFGIADDGVVQAVDRADDFCAVVLVGAVGIARGQLIGDGEQGRAVVLVHGPSQSLGERGPGLGLVHALENRVQSQRVGQRSIRVRGLEGQSPSLVEEVPYLLDAGVGITRQRAVLGALTVLNIGAQKAFEALGLPQ